MQNPSIPYSGPIEGGFGEGRMVRIQGTTLPTANRFNINLQCGATTSDDIALHVSVRISEGFIARNSQLNEEWGDEQAGGKLLIGLDQRFEIILLSAASDYKIAINGQHFAEFPHLISSSRISYLTINGDVTLSLISIEGGNVGTKTSSMVQQTSAYGVPTEQSGASAGDYAPQQYGGHGAPSQGQYGLPPQGQYGHPPQGQYGPPSQGQYGPPPQGQYGPPSQNQYGAPMPPGYQQEQESGLEGFLGTASSVIAGAISSGMADKLISSLTSGGSQQSQQNQQHQQPHLPPPVQEPTGINLPQFGGQGSVGGLGTLGSLFGTFAEQVLHPKRDGQH